MFLAAANAPVAGAKILPSPAAPPAAAAEPEPAKSGRKGRVAKSGAKVVKEEAEEEEEMPKKSGGKKKSGRQERDPGNYFHDFATTNVKAVNCTSLIEEVTLMGEL